MSKVIRFYILGKPQGKARPRFRRVGKFVSTYNPKNTQEYEKNIQNSIKKQCSDEINANYSGNIEIEIKAIFEPPKSTSKKKYNELIGTPYLHKPDYDNIGKIICDALNGIAYKDDCQISRAKVEKIYGIENKVVVIIEYCDEE